MGEKVKNETEGKTLYDAADYGEYMPFVIRPMPKFDWSPPKQKYTKRLRNISRWRQ